MTQTAVTFGTDRRRRRIVLLRYVLVLTAMSLVWEFAQMPLYTLGQTGTASEVAYAAFHCTAGDALIGGFSLLAAMLALGPSGWPREGRVRVLVAATAFGLGYTVFSEWLNVELRGSWAYSELMPVVPIIGTGLAPLLQWVVIPLAAYVCVLSIPRGSQVDTTPAAGASGAPAQPSNHRGDGWSSDRAANCVESSAPHLAWAPQAKFRQAAQRM